MQPPKREERTPPAILTRASALTALAALVPSRKHGMCSGSHIVKKWRDGFVQSL